MKGVVCWCDSPTLTEFITDLTSTMLVIENNQISEDSPLNKPQLFYLKAINAIIKNMLNGAEHPLIKELKSIATGDYGKLVEVVSEIQDNFSDFFDLDYYCDSFNINTVNNIVELTLRPKLTKEEVTAIKKMFDEKQPSMSSFIEQMEEINDV